MQEPSDQLLPYNRYVLQTFFKFILVAEIFSHFCFCSELVVIFLKFLYDQDPVRQLLDLSEADYDIEIDL